MAYKYNTLNDDFISINNTISVTQQNLQKLLQINIINDAFHIWYNGPYATINNFRLGKLATHPIEWQEINAALGEAAAAVYTIANRSKVEFKNYIIIPIGSFTKIAKVEDKNTFYSLFSDGSYSIFPKRNFNIALQGLLTCIDEIGEHVIHHDPTLQLPYKINSAEGKINNQSILVGSDDEQWTRALKYMLSDIKWIIAWSAKHLQHLS